MKTRSSSSRTALLAISLSTAFTGPAFAWKINLSTSMPPADFPSGSTAISTITIFRPTNTSIVKPITWTRSGTAPNFTYNAQLEVLATEVNTSQAYRLEFKDLRNVVWSTTSLTAPGSSTATVTCGSATDNDFAVFTAANWTSTGTLNLGDTLDVGGNALVLGTKGAGAGAVNGFSWTYNPVTDGLTSHGTDANSTWLWKKASDTSPVMELSSGSLKVNGQSVLTNVSTVSNSVAVGLDALADGVSSSAFGINVGASGEGASVFGRSSYAQGADSVAIGNSTYAAGFKSIAMGYSSQALADFSTSAGFGAVAQGDSSTAVGFYSQTGPDAWHSFAAGAYSNVWAYGSLALGYASQAQGACALSTGFNSWAAGYNSMAVGSSATAMADSSAAIGEGTYVSQSTPGVTVVGRFNDPAEENQVPGALVVAAGDFVVGTGADGSSRSNGLIVKQNGQVLVKQLLITDPAVIPGTPFSRF